MKLIDDAALAAVEKPADYDVVMWFDLGPMRPDDYYRQTADAWTEAVALRNVASGAIAAVRDEYRKVAPKLAAKAAEKVQAAAAVDQFRAMAMATKPGRVG